jgi:hypothetical protein
VKVIDYSNPILKIHISQNVYKRHINTFLSLCSKVSTKGKLFLIKMLSKLTLRWIQLATKMMRYSGAAPLYWKKSSSAGADKNEGFRIHLTPSIRLRILAAIHFSNLLFYEVFMAYRVTTTILRFVQKKDVPLQTVFQVLWNLICYAIPLFIQINQFYRWKEVPTFINGYVSFLEQFESISFLTSTDDYDLHTIV